MLDNDWTAQCLDFLKDKKNIIVQDQREAQSSAPYNIVVPRSACPNCQHQITALENIPVISYLFLRGKCKSCRTSIAIRYPIVELSTALLSTATAWYFGVTLNTCFAIIFIWTLVSLSMIDFDTKLLPDDITLPFIWLGLIVNYIGFQVPFEQAFIGAVAGYLILWSVFWLFKLLTKKDGMGYGDFKLLAGLGAWLGIQAVPIVILISSVVGCIIGISLIIFKGRERSNPIPFGPYLAIAGVIYLFYGQPLQNFLFPY